VKALRALSAEKLLTTKQSYSSMTVDGYAITEQPYLTYARGANHEQALLSGFNAHEAGLFALFDKVTSGNYVNLLTKVLGDGAAEAAGGAIVIGDRPSIRLPRPALDKFFRFLETGTVE
jgi:para-nitrobenzyl esterase